MEQFGPLYCETPVPIGGPFPIEPWNSISSGVIVLFGLAGWWLVYRRAPKDLVLHALCFMLVLNGVGSILWHGLRTRWALTLDVWPAIVFVLLAAFMWARKFVPLWQAVAAAAALIVLPMALRYLPLDLPGGGMMLRGVVIVAAGVWLVAVTMPLSRPAAASGAAALGLAITALVFRSIDRWSCDHIAHGSHFLWHIFLSSAAFMLVLTIVTLKDRRASYPSRPA